MITICSTLPYLIKFNSLFRVVSFSRPVRFKEVYIGRCADLPANAMQGMEADMKVKHSVVVEKKRMLANILPYSLYISSVLCNIIFGVFILCVSELSSYIYTSD